MSPIEIIAPIALAAFAVYRQTTVSEVSGRGRFSLAIIYAGIGLVIGGWVLPHTALAIGLLVLTIALGAVIGVARGYKTRIWRSEDGRVLQKGSALTIALFFGLVLAKFGIGTFEYLTHMRDTAGFGEILVMIAVMVAVQSQIIWIRARRLIDGGTETAGTTGTQGSGRTLETTTA